MVKGLEISAYKFSELSKLFDKQIVPWIHWIPFYSLLTDGFLSLICPDYLVICQNSLTFMVQNPLNSGFLDCVYEVFVTVTNYSFHRLDHFFLKVVQPHLYVEPCTDSIYKLNVFSLRADKSLNCGWSFFFYVDHPNSLEKFVDVLLYYAHIVGIGQDLYKLVVGNEVKSWKESSFDLKIVF